MGEMICISRFELRQLLDAQRQQLLQDIGYRMAQAVEQALVDAGVKSPMLSKAEAYRRFGRAHVDDWVRKGYVRECRDGSGKRIRLSLSQLVERASQSNIPCRAVRR